MRPLLTFALATAALAVPAQAKAQPGDPVVNVASSDATMNAAIAKGRHSLPEFFERVAKPHPGESGFVVKFDLLPEATKAEFVWGQVISRSPGFTLVRIANAPVDPRWKLGQQISVRDADVIDWGYMKDGVMQGHFTTRVLLPTLSPAAADAIRKAYRW